ncbi:unnamed protein product [Vicia faba]|uniref:Uncharacterized protein n=1 Tax=Vicia faba TaxID=3906 RepID=A0AAV0ZM76_VICFA|nr:unnamed protein product [Vicia faba]
MEIIERSLCYSFWRSNDFDFAFKPSEGRSGKWEKEESLCLMGDFNAIIEISERKGGGESVKRVEIEDFDDFISMSELVDFLLHDRRFSWFRPRDVVMR